MISQYDKDMCCLYIAEGMNYIWQQRENQELSRILESLADRKLMKRVHGGYAITLKGLLAVKVWRLHLFLFHHGEYKGFKPWNINGEPVPASVEKGCFEFYEVKSCMADFTSGNGLTFYGDQNYLVCTKELCDEIVWQKMVPPRVNAILTPDSTGSKLILDYVQSYNDLSYRRRPASEILWAMVKANGKRTN